MKKMLAVTVLALLASFSGSIACAQETHSDKEFLKTASQGNVAEVELAKLALKKTGDPQVRMFAQRMIQDHQMLGRKMAPFLAEAGVQGSTSLDLLHQHLYNKLSGLSGAEFDKEYVEAMDKDHHGDLADFRKEIASTQYPSLKATVISGEKVIAEHTEMIDGIARKMGIAPSGS